MTRHQSYRPFSTCPHTYGVRPRPCSAIATESCRPTACFREWQCFPTWAGGSPTIVHCSFYIVHCWTYTCSAKERDSETGLSYFGSRYYSSDLSVWLSVDPQSDKYASLSPYVYCANNPVKLVDPNGEEIDDIYINTRTKQVSVIKTNDDFDRIIVGGVYSGNREKGAEISERTQQGYSINTMNIRYKRPSMSKISDYSMSVLIDVMNASVNTTAVINSTTRTPEDQVRILCENIQNQGLANQRALYADPGRQVIDCYPNRDVMLAKIYELGPQSVSKHCADPSILNVFDVEYASITNKSDFHTALGQNALVSKYLSPFNSNDLAFHIEIKQPFYRQPKCILK